MSEPTTRFNAPSSAPRGSVVSIRALVSHPMETGDRKDAGGKLVPRRIVERFVVTFNGHAVFSCALGTGISANPFFEFHLRLPEGGELEMVWLDQDGSIYRDTARIEAT